MRSEVGQHVGDPEGVDNLPPIPVQQREVLFSPSLQARLVHITIFAGLSDVVGPNLKRVLMRELGIVKCNVNARFEGFVEAAFTVGLYRLVLTSEKGICEEKRGVDLP